jgi:hypothetical protein
MRFKPDPLSVYSLDMATLCEWLLVTPVSFKDDDSCVLVAGWRPCTLVAGTFSNMQTHGATPAGIAKNEIKGTVLRDWDWQRVLLLVRSVLGEIPMTVLYFPVLPLSLNDCKQKRSTSEKRDKNFHVFADSHWAMLWKAIGQPLSNAKKLEKNRWKMAKSCT